MFGNKSRYTLRRYRAEEMVEEYMSGERFEDCFNMMMVMEDTDRFEYYEITYEEILSDGTEKLISKSYYTKCAEDIDEIYF